MGEPDPKGRHGVAMANLAVDLSELPVQGVPPVGKFLDVIPTRRVKIPPLGRHALIYLDPVHGGVEVAPPPLPAADLLVVQDTQQAQRGRAQYVLLGPTQASEVGQVGGMPTADKRDAAAMVSIDFHYAEHSTQARAHANDGGY